MQEGSHPGYGGYTETARYLHQRSGRKITRQQVYTWYRRRHVNGFPALKDVAGDAGDTRHAFDLLEVWCWLTVYLSTRLGDQAHRDS